MSKTLSELKDLASIEYSQREWSNEKLATVKALKPDNVAIVQKMEELAHADGFDSCLQAMKDRGVEGEFWFGESKKNKELLVFHNEQSALEKIAVPVRAVAYETHLAALARIAEQEETIKFLRTELNDWESK